MKTIAVIGCGRIATFAHFPALTQLEDVRIKYACDLIEQKALTAKEKWAKIENVITDYKIALADSEVDAVWVLTPNASHHPIVMDALRAGKHVLCEKPVAVSYDLACEMAAEAKKQDKLLHVGVCSRHNQTVRTLRDMVQSGKLGNIYHVYCSFRAPRNIPGLGGAFTTKALSGGGVLIDWGVHLFDLILYILGNPALKTASCNTYCEMAKDMTTYRYKTMWAEDTSDTVNGINDVDDFATGFLRTEGPSITFNGAWAQNIDGIEQYVDFLGDKGGVRFDYNKKTFTYFDGQTLEVESPECPNPNQFLAEDRAFLDSMDRTERDSNYIDNILETSKLLTALYDSAEAGKEITL